MYNSDRLESHLYNYSNIIELLQTLVELWHFQTIRGKKSCQMALKFSSIILNDQHFSFFIMTPNVTF